MTLVVAMNLPKPATKLLAVARSTVERMQGNTLFPAPTPSLATLLADIDALAAAEANLLTRRKGSREERDEKLAVLRRDLKQLASYVQSIADANGTDGAAVVESTAFAVKRPSIRTKPAFRVAAGRSPGSVNLLAKWAADRALYEWRYSMDRTTWVSLPATIQSSTTVSGFVPLTAYFFQNRVTTTGGRGDWGDPVSFSLS